MAVFFFVVGLEIKRELMVGELASVRKAALPAAAALGGMVVPALIYAGMNMGGPQLDGWGIPMATDIAFAIGVLALLGSRAPVALKVFLTAIAIVDDLGAVLVIAFFYTGELSMSALGVAGLTLLALIFVNRLGFRGPLPYMLLGIVLWVAFLQSGVHATVAGVLLAITIPARRAVDATEYLDQVKRYVAEFEEEHQPGMIEPTEDQWDAVHSLEVVSERLETPLTRLEHGLHPWAVYFVMPVFALANAGVTLGGDVVGMLTGTVSLGIIAGLFFGKQAGILAASWLAVKMGAADLPGSVTWRQIWGVGLICGIGFTMSLFIANLAFETGGLLGEAKMGILAASLLSGVAGAVVLVTASGRSGTKSVTNRAITEES